MRKMILLAAALFAGVVVFGQEKEAQKEEVKKNWNYVANVGVNISQASFSNWALGGEGSVGGIAVLNLGANYKQGKQSWDNSFVGQYGMQKVDGQETKKSIDIFDLNSKYGYQIASHWSLAALVGVKSQFSKSYSYSKDGDKAKISNLFAPGYITTALGFDYKPNKWFSALLSPVTGKHTLVLDDELSEAGAFGVEKGKKYRAELGAIINAKMQKEVMKNINLASTLSLFSAYNNHFGNVDVAWDVALSMKVNKYISATINTSLLYDDDISNDIQFKEVIGVGLAYNFMQ